MQRAHYFQLKSPFVRTSLYLWCLIVSFGSQLTWSSLRTSHNSNCHSVCNNKGKNPGNTESNKWDSNSPEMGQFNRTSERELICTTCSPWKHCGWQIRTVICGLVGIYIPACGDHSNESRCTKHSHYAKWWFSLSRNAETLQKNTSESVFIDKGKRNMTSRQTEQSVSGASISEVLFADENCLRWAVGSLDDQNQSQLQGKALQTKRKDVTKPREHAPESLQTRETQILLELFCSCSCKVRFR